MAGGWWLLEWKFTPSYLASGLPMMLPTLDYPTEDKHHKSLSTTNSTSLVDTTLETSQIRSTLSIQKIIQSVLQGPWPAGSRVHLWSNSMSKIQKKKNIVSCVLYQSYNWKGLLRYNLSITQIAWIWNHCLCLYWQIKHFFYIRFWIALLSWSSTIT